MKPRPITRTLRTRYYIKVYTFLSKQAKPITVHVFLSQIETDYELMDDVAVAFEKRPDSGIMQGGNLSRL